jgi:hypothetical protein
MRFWGVLVVIAAVLFTLILLAPIIEVNTAGTSSCPPTPSRIAAGPPFCTHLVYWSITAYYLGIGALYASGSGYSFVS